MLSKRTTFTSCSALPHGIPREAAIAFLQDFEQMIDLNPLVKERHRITPPPHASSDEQDCTWYSITDKIAYLPGGLAEGDVTYTCAFNPLDNGIQTHCYAPAGLDLREKWTVNGTVPGETPQPQELGIGAPTTGLYLREDVDMRCNVLMSSFVRKTLVKAHSKLVDQIKAKVQADEAEKNRRRPPEATSHHYQQRQRSSSGPHASQSPKNHHAAASRKQYELNGPPPQYTPETKERQTRPNRVPASAIGQHMQHSQHIRSSSIPSTPLSAVDRRMIPDPLHFRSRSSDRVPTRGHQHPDYPAMNPYTPEGMTDESPVAGIKDPYLMPARKPIPQQGPQATPTHTQSFVAELE